MPKSKLKSKVVDSSVVVTEAESSKASVVDDLKLADPDEETANAILKGTTTVKGGSHE